MATPTTLLKAILAVKEFVYEGNEFGKTDDGVKYVVLDVRPYKRFADRCPYCGRKCSRYDNGNTDGPRKWRAPDWGGLKVYLRAQTHRVNCPVHGVVTAAVPWAFHDSGFTKEFDFTVSWLAARLSKTAVSAYMRVDWKTVGRCLERTFDKLEPDPKQRLKGLVNIGVDETSYRKGHKYITVVVNHDTNTVVWVHDGHGKEVFSQFFKELSAEDRASIKTISGDGAQWIDACIKEYVPHVIRCTDPYHVVSWANEMLDGMRREIWQKHRAEAKKHEQAAKEAGDDKDAARRHEELRRASSEQASTVKGATFALGKRPENLTQHQGGLLELIEAREPKLYKAYQYKEELRAILHLKQFEAAYSEIKSWFFRATHSRLKPVIALARKIRRHEQGILNAIQYRCNSARVEAINNKIKLVIRRAFGFRNIKSLMAMVMMVCSSVEVPLPNRPRQEPILNL